MQNLTPVLTDAATLRAKLHTKTVGALTAAFPLDLKGRTLELHDVKVHAQDYTPTDEYNALMKGSSLNEPVKGTLVLKGADGKVIDTAKNFTLTHLPFLTSRHTLISDGNEYQVANQLRRKPGVYTQRSDNGELKTVFNLGRGKNFDVVFNENKGTFHLQYGTSNLPLYAVLRGLGVSHEHIAGKLGAGVAQENEKEHGHQVATTMAKLYTKLEHPALIKPSATHEEKVLAVKKRYDIATLDSDVTHATLGHAYDKVSPDVMLAAAKKILQVHKGERPVDDTDSLTFKTFHSMDDFIAERIRLTARAWSPKAKMALNGKSVIRDALKPAPFSDSIKKFLTTSSLSAVPTGINPMEILDHSVKVTSLGEGGIPSDRAIPLDARMIHNTQFGALDPIRTPESSHSGVDIRATIAAHRDDKGNLYTVMRNVKTGKDEYIRSGDLSHMTVAFPHQQMVGKVDAFHNGEQARVEASKVTHQLNHVTHIYSPATTLIPFIHSIQGNRAIMGSKMGTQALPLLDREAPLVQVRSHLPEGHSFEQVYGHMIVPKAPVSGTVAKIDKDYVWIRPHAEKKGEEAPLPLPGRKLYTYVPTEALASILSKGLHSGKSLLSEPKALEAAAKGRGTTSELLAADIQAQLQSHKAYRVLGPNAVSHLIPDTAVLSDKHPTRMHALTPVEIDVDALTKAQPATMFYGMELQPWVAGTPPNTRHHYVDVGHLDRMAAKTPAEYWSTYNDPEDKGHYAPDVPHVAIHTQTGSIPGKFLRVAALAKTAEDRPVIEQKKLGPHTFNIEIKKDHLVPGNKYPSTSDYGHLPGYTGPDGDSLDFFVGNHPHGVLAVLDKQKNFDGKGWVTTDKKFCVGMDPKEYAAWRAHPAMTSHPSIRYANDKHFKDWGHLQRHIDEHFKNEKSAADKDEKGLVKVPYHQFFPFPSKTYLHHDLGVKAGDTVKEGQRLGESNYTKNGTLALGKNLLVGYMPYYGFNSNDAVVISDACSKKLTSEHMYREVYPLSSQIELNKEKHRMYYGTKYQPDAYGKLDNDGVIKKGSRVNAKEPLVLGLTKQAILGTDAMLGRISKALAKPYKEVTLIWDHGAPGEVIDVVRTNSQITVLVRTQERMQVGDKLAGRYGNKGVVAKIVPDHEMLQDEQGRPIDLLLTSAGVVSRINPAQVIETAVSKVAEKTGKPIVYDNAAGHNAVKWARELMDSHGVKDKEHLFDPVLNRKIKGGDGKGVLVGRQFIYKLFKSTDTNFAGHGVGPYDLNEQPLKTGGDDSAKGIGKMEFDALLAHNARNFLREAATVKGQKNDEFWKAVQTGMPLPQPKPSFAFNKFTAMLEGSGIKVDKRGSKMTLMPLTDQDVVKRSAGVIENNKTIQSKNLRPEKGGLFDPIKTGGNQGTLYAHIDLHEPIPNPVFKDPVRRLLGLSEKEFDKAVHDQGGAWFHSELQKIDVPKKIQNLRGQMKTAKGPALNDIVKQVKSLEALQKNNMKPHEAYVISKIPVIPPVFRPILPGVRDPSQLMVADANKLYAQLMDSTDTLKRTAMESDRGKHRLDVYSKVEELYGVTLPQDAKMQQQKVKGFLATIAGVGTPKGGFFQRKLMRHTQDVSGRGTAVPDANLNMDEVGVPEQMLWQMLDKLIVARLIRKGYPALQAREMVTKKDPTAHQAMLEESKERPLWINRAPTLHRWGIIAAYAKPVQGKTLRVSPFIETGMNLDYDGDTLQVHVPVTPDAVHDAKNMTMTNLLLSDQQRNRLMAFPQHEAIIGFTHAAKNTEAKGPVKIFKTREDVLAAWRKGDLKMSDAIEVQSTKHAEETEADNYGLGETLSAGFSIGTPEAALSYFPPENVTGVDDEDQEEADVPLSR